MTLEDIPERILTPSLKRAVSDFSFIIIAVPVLLGFWAGVPEIKDLAIKKDTGAPAQQPALQWHDIRFIVIVFLSGHGYVFLFVSKILMGGPVFQMLLVLGTFTKCAILLTVTVRHPSNHVEYVVIAVLSIAITCGITFWDDWRAKNNNGDHDPSFIISISNRIRDILKKVGLEPVPGDIEMGPLPSDEQDNSSQEEVSTNDHISHSVMLKAFFHMLQQIVQQGCAYMHWATVLILGYGNLVAIFQNNPKMWVFLLIYTTIGCLSFHGARICKTLSYGFLLLAFLGSWMQMLVWFTVLFSIYFHNALVCVLLIIGSGFLTFTPIATKLYLIRKSASTVVPVGGLDGGQPPPTSASASVRTSSTTAPPMSLHERSLTYTGSFKSVHSKQAME